MLNSQYSEASVDSEIKPILPKSVLDGDRKPGKSKKKKICIGISITLFLGLAIAGLVVGIIFFQKRW